MQRQLSFRQYRVMDLFFFTALLCLCESLIVLGATQWFPQEPYTLSLTAAVTAIVFTRWGAWGLIPALGGSLAFCLASGATSLQYLIYLGSAFFALILIPCLRVMPWQRLRASVLAALLYGLIASLALEAGRFIIALMLGTAPGLAAGFFTTDVLSALFAVILCGVCRSLDGIMEDQKHYLLRIHKEKEQGEMNP